MDGSSHLLHHQHQQQHHQYHHLQQQQQQQLMSGGLSTSIGTGGGGGGGSSGGGGSMDNRVFPQWSIQETKEFLMIRAELDRSFMETKRNKALWEVIATRMREKGYNRSSEQCKCKWKNLVTRYKGCETVEAEAMRHQQFPYYNEMQAIMETRMHRMLWAETDTVEGRSTGGGLLSSSRNKRAIVPTVSGQHHILSSDEEDEEDSEQYVAGAAVSGGGGEQQQQQIHLQRTSSTPTSTGVSLLSRKIRKQKSKLNVTGAAAAATSSSNSNFAELKEMLDNFMKQQIHMEMQWREMYEQREEERRMMEMEWRQKMEALEHERLVMEKRWMEKEEQRRMREECRADKRDALITALLNKLRRDEN